MPEGVFSVSVLELGLLGLGLLCLVLIVFVLAALHQEKKAAADRSRQSEATLAEYIENLVQDSEQRLQAAVAQQQGAMIAQLQLQQTGQDAWGQGLAQRMEAAFLSQDSRLAHLDQVLNTRLGQSDQTVSQVRETLFTSLTQMQKDNADKLEQMRQTVDEHLHTTLSRRLGESFQLVNDRLEAVYKGLGEMKSLASGVGDLKKVLSNIKTRGTWGETQLALLLQEALAPAQYEVNCAVQPGSQERVEFAVRLPGPEESQPVLLPIDAKFPLEDYQRLQVAQENGDKIQLDSALVALERAIAKEAERIASKYIKPPYTTDFAILYLPVEGLYAEALRLPGLADRLQRDLRVSLAGPTTLLALLNSLQMGFRTLAIQQRSAQVWHLLSQVKGDFAAFGQILDKTQQRLRQASESIDLAHRRSRSITRRLSAVEALDGSQETEEAAGYIVDEPD